MNYIIIEDEQYNAELLESMVKQSDNSKVLLAVLSSIEESVEWLNSNPSPDIIFMDIRLSDGLSFDIYKKVKITSPVIFTTAYDEYALQAFKVFGTAYLLKPIIKKELDEVLNKVLEFRPLVTNDDINHIFDMFQTQQKKYKTRFLLHFRETYKVILTENIDFIFLKDKIVYFRLVDRSSVLVPYSLEELEEQLDPDFFFRVNRQFILQINSIESMHKYYGEKTKIILKNDRESEVIVSRIKMPQFKLWLDR